MNLIACAPVSFSENKTDLSSENGVEVTDVSFFENNAGGDRATTAAQDTFVESTIGTVVTGQTVAVQTDQTTLNLGFLATLIGQ